MMKMSMVFGTVAAALVIRETDSESEALPCCVFSLCWWRSGVRNGMCKGCHCHRLVCRTRRGVDVACKSEHAFVLSVLAHLLLVTGWQARDLVFLTGHCLLD